MLNKIGNMTINEVLEKVKIFQINLWLPAIPTKGWDIKFDLNYKSALLVGANLVIYSLFLITFDRFVYNRPIPSGLSTQDIIVIRHIRSVGRL
jgi:hypothetical protein